MEKDEFTNKFYETAYSCGLSSIHAMQPEPVGRVASLAPAKFTRESAQR